MTVGSNKVKDVVARKLRGLPAAIEEPQVRNEGDEMCCDCGVNPVAEKGSQAHAQGLCVQCATFKRRTGEWRDQPIPGSKG